MKLNCSGVSFHIEANLGDCLNKLIISFQPDPFHVIHVIILHAYCICEAFK